MTRSVRQRRTPGLLLDSTLCVSLMNPLLQLSLMAWTKRRAVLGRRMC
uniref:Heat shock protein 70 n=1 Tax=Rhizophora mucronata TaxID=61149 RepID=A0A2P2PJW7_RHIMU